MIKNDEIEALEIVGEELIILKLVLVGDTNVGKTSILYQRAEHRFESQYTMTIGIDFRPIVHQSRTKQFKIQCWDTSGQERFNSLTEGYFRTAHGILLVFDVHDRDSFEHLEKWMEMIRLRAAINVPIIVVGNKSDLRSFEVLPRSEFVTNEEAESWATENHLIYYEVTAKNNEQISKLFVDIFEKMIVYDHEVREKRDREEREQLREIGRNARANTNVKFILNDDGDVFSIAGRGGRHSSSPRQSNEKSKCCGFY